MIDMKDSKKLNYIFKEIKRGNNPFNFALKRGLLFVFLTLLTGALDFWIITNLPSIINNLDLSIKSDFRSIKFLLISISALFARIFALKQLTVTSVFLSEISNDLNLRFISLSNSKYVGKVNPDYVRIQLLNNSYDLHRYIIIPSLSAIYSIILSVFISYAAIVVSPYLSLALFLFLSFIYSLIFYFSKNKYEKLSKRLDEDFSKLDSQTREYSENLKEIYLYNMFDYMTRIIKPLRSNLYSTFSSTVFHTRLPRHLIESAIVIMIALVVIFTQFAIVPIEIKGLFGKLFALGIAGARIIILLSQIFNSVVNVKTYNHYLNSGIDFNKRIFNEVNGKNDNKENYLKNSSSRKDNIHTLVINSIKSRFIAASQKNPINLEIQNQGIVLIKGPSGSGKTSLLNILSNFIIPEKGKISIIEDKNFLRSIHKNDIAYASQYPLLFEDDLAFNISLQPKDKINLEKLLKISLSTGCFDYGEYSKLTNKNKANLYKLVSTFLKKDVGRNGSKISGGQRKRISLARALYSNRKIILLDEPTAGLDSNFEKYILNTIKKESQKYIFIISTHIDKLDDVAKNIINL